MRGPHRTAVQPTPRGGWLARRTPLARRQGAPCPLRSRPEKRIAYVVSSLNIHLALSYARLRLPTQMAALTPHAALSTTQALLQHFGWDSYLPLVEPFHEDATAPHLAPIRERLGVPYTEMVFFDHDRKRVREPNVARSRSASEKRSGWARFS